MRRWVVSLVATIMFVAVPVRAQGYGFDRRESGASFGFGFRSRGFSGFYSRDSYRSSGGGYGGGYGYDSGYGLGRYAFDREGYAPPNYTVGYGVGGYACDRGGFPAYGPPYATHQFGGWDCTTCRCRHRFDQTCPVDHFKWCDRCKKAVPSWHRCRDD